MAQVEIYKLKKTVDPDIKDHGMFEFFGLGGPFPKNYVREWAGELPSNDLDTLCGKFFLNPPKGYHSEPLEKGDIAVVDGEAYFLDRESGYKFVEVNFDTTGIKEAVHVNYGRYVSTDGAAPIPRTFAAVCESLDIPIGYLGEPGYHGSSKGESDFDRMPLNDFTPCYLHPQFMKGEEAQSFVGLLTQLFQTEQWEEIAGYLRDSYPVTMSDLEAARKQFTPELLLPTELRPMSKHIPLGTDKAELDYLTAKVGALDDEQRNILYAVVEVGWHCGSVTEIINLTENLDCFTLQQADSISDYGEYRLGKDWDECEAAINRLENSDDPSDQALRKYITLLGRCVDDEAYGYHAAKEDGGAFTQYGLITYERGIEEIYRGVQDIPAGFREAEPLSGETERQAIMVCNTDLPALLLQMHALGGDYMRDAKQNLQAFAGGGTDFLVMMNNAALIITPADLAFHKETSEYELWTSAGGEPEVSAFLMSVTDRGEGRVTGNLYEVTLDALQSYIHNHSISSDEPDAESRLVTFLDVLRWAVEENRRAIPTAVFLQQLNEPYMACSQAPQSDWYRVSPEAARDYLAQGGQFIFKTYPEPPALLTTIDAAKTSLWTGGRYEFSIRHSTGENLERWAKRTAGEMLRQNERGDHKKSHDVQH